MTLTPGQIKVELHWTVLS